jgi:carbamoyltransferase
MTRSTRTNIDRVALAIQPPRDLLKFVLDDLFRTQRVDRWIYRSLLSTSVTWDKYFLLYPYWYNWIRIRNVKRLLRKYDLDGIPIDLVDHHLAHAASAYYTSGKEDAFVVTLDGQGDGLAGTVYHGVGGDLIKANEVSSFHSLGLFYNFVTWMLGYKPMRHEGKITGLAAYGDASKTIDAFRTLFRMEGPEFRYELSKRTFQHAYPQRSNYPKFLAAANGILDGHTPADIAAGVQILSEECTKIWVAHHLEKYLAGRPEGADVCMAGGVYSNVKINQRVAELDGVRSVFIFPAMMDGGLSVGSALYAYYKHRPEAKKNLADMRLRDVYLGPAYTEEEIRKSLERSGLRHEFVP